MSDIDTLKRLYYEEKLSQQEVAQHLGTHQATVYKVMKMAGLPPLSMKERARILDAKGVYDSYRKQVSFECDECQTRSSMPLSQWLRSKKHYCSKNCRLAVLSKERGKATIRGRQQEEKWLSQQSNIERIFRCSELPDFMRVTPTGIEFFEVKSRRFHVRNNQKETIRRLKELGFHVEVVVMPN